MHGFASICTIIGGMTTVLDVRTPLLTVADAATYLNVSADTVRRLINSGALPARRLSAQRGAHLRILRDDLASYVNEMAELAECAASGDFDLDNGSSLS